MASDERASFSIDAKAVRLLAKILNETNLTEIEYELEGGRIRVVRQGHSETSSVPSMVHQVTVPSVLSAQEETPESTVTNQETDFSKHPGAVKSPMVGVAYLSPDPEAPHYVGEGDHVEAGQTLLILEAMKVMNPIRAPRAGKIQKILVTNGQAIEYGEILMVIN